MIVSFSSMSARLVGAIDRRSFCVWARGGAVGDGLAPWPEAGREGWSDPPAGSLTIRWLVTHESTKSCGTVLVGQDFHLVIPRSILQRLGGIHTHPRDRGLAQAGRR